MTTQDLKPKLTAILSMGFKSLGPIRDEDEGLKMVTAIIEQHRGSVVESAPKRILAQFQSVLAAVQCAVEIERGLKAKNVDLPQGPKIEFRIGINLGDMVEEEGRIWGDGPATALRVEGLADWGGICISGTAYDQVKEKMSLGYEYLGEHAVEGIKIPVRVYRILTEPDAAGKMIGEEKRISRMWPKVAVAALLLAAVAGWVAWHFFLRTPPAPQLAWIDKTVCRLPGKPTIAVLPFDNMSRDPKQEYFSDGITEEIITSLSKVPDMSVIARNSSFTYKGKPVKVQQVAEDLDVKYVLEGSVRKDRYRVRITAQLVDGSTGHHLWAESYDRNLKDLFALQDEIALKILAALQVELTEGDEARLWAKGTDNLQAYFKVLEARKYISLWSKKGMSLAREAAKEAIELDPRFAKAYTRLGWTYLHNVSYGWSKSPEKNLDRARELAQKALGLDDSIPDTYILLSGIYLRRLKLKECIGLRKKAIALDPKNARSISLLAIALNADGRAKEAIELFEKAICLDPITENWILHFSGCAYRLNGEYEKAIEAFESSIHRDPDFWLSHCALAACYGLLGRDEEARKEAQEVLRIRPGFSLARIGPKIGGVIQAPNKSDRERIIDTIRKAGLK